MTTKTATLSLSESEVQCVFRALIEYRKSLDLSALRDSTYVFEEIAAADAVSEKISLNFHYPIGAPYVFERG